MKKSLIVLVVASILTLLLVACGEANTSSVIPTSHSTAEATPSLAPQPDTVHMNNGEFLQSTITVEKGKSIVLVDDVAVLHVVANGSWESNGLSRYKEEAGAPKIDVQFNGKDSHSIGPFNTVGTFHLYCTVHQGMNLTIIVQ